MNHPETEHKEKAIHKGLLRKVLWHRCKRIFIRNPVDKEFEKTLLAFGESLNANVLRERPTAVQVVNTIIRHTMELGELDKMYIKILVPHTQKSIKRYNAYAKKSFYLQLLQKEKQYDGELDEIIRLGYVHLYHKFENFQTELIVAFNAHFSAQFNVPVDLEKFLYDTYQYKIRDLKNQPATLQTINWICNCVKHRNGYPIKEPVPEKFAGINKLEKIVVAPATLRKDIEFMMQHFGNMCTTYIAIGMAQHAHSLVQKMDKTNPGTAQMVKELHAHTMMHLLNLTGRFPAE